eukprot:6199097-Pleurochrysis_carterae.AAC.1
MARDYAPRQRRRSSPQRPVSRHARVQMLSSHRDHVPCGRNASHAPKTPRRHASSPRSAIFDRRRTAGPSTRTFRRMRRMHRSQRHAAAARQLSLPALPRRATDTCRHCWDFHTHPARWIPVRANPCGRSYQLQIHTLHAEQS